MVVRDVVFSHQGPAIAEVIKVIERYDPEVAARLRGLSPGGAIPNTAKSPDLFAVYLCEAVAVLSRRLDELEEASKPRPRGRPPKQEAS